MMAAGNPNWHNMHRQSNIHSNSPLFSLLHHQLSLHGESSPSSSTSSSSPSTNSSLPFNSLIDEQSAPQDFPQSWSQLLLGTEMNPSSLDHTKVDPHNENMMFGHDDDKQDQLVKQGAYGQSHGHGGHAMNYHHEAIHYQLPKIRPSLLVPVSSRISCVTSLCINNNTNNNSNFIDFSSNNTYKDKQQAHLSSEGSEERCDTIGGTTKKPRVQSSSIPPLKIRKEKLGDKITALHQIVSPFGKTDTASVLLETIGCITFLQAQIQALSSPYLGIPPSKNNQLNYIAKDETLKELRSKGLCLVPTHLVGTDNSTATEYWAPSIAGGF